MTQQRIRSSRQTYYYCFPKHLAGCVISLSGGIEVPESLWMCLVQEQSDPLSPSAGSVPRKLPVSLMFEADYILKNDTRDNHKENEFFVIKNRYGSYNKIITVPNDELIYMKLAAVDLQGM